MASIVLTNNAKFTPYTFDEMLKPLAMATQEQRAIEEGISELGSKADLMKMYANEEPNAEWSKKYNDYANSLYKQAEDLAKHGLNPTSRQGLLNLKRQYGESVTPIEEAISARKEAYKYRDTIKAKDNTAVFKNKNLSLSDFMNGKVGDNTYISGKDIMARVASKAQIEGTNLFNSLLEQGYTSEAALQAVNNWSRNTANPIIAEELKAIGYENYSPEDQAKLMNSIGTGMYNAASEIAKGEYMTKKERKSLELQEASAARQLKQYELAIAKHNLDMAEAGYKYDEKTKSYIPDENSPVWTKDATGKLIKAPKASKSSSNKESFSKIPKPISIDSKGRTSVLNLDDIPSGGKIVDYNSLTGNDKAKVDAIIGNDIPENNIIMKIPSGFNSRSEIIVIPRDLYNQYVNSEGINNYENK